MFYTATAFPGNDLTEKSARICELYRLHNIWPRARAQEHDYFAGELPQYEVMGFPISAHQMSVLQSGGTEEQSLTPMLTLQGMPASPHQIAVIGFRTKQYARAEIGGRAIFDLGPQ